MYSFKYVGGVSWAGLAVRYAKTTMVDKLETRTQVSPHRITRKKGYSFPSTQCL